MADGRNIGKRRFCHVLTRHRGFSNFRKILCDYTKSDSNDDRVTSATNFKV